MTKEVLALIKKINKDVDTRTVTLTKTANIESILEQVKQLYGYVHVEVVDLDESRFSVNQLKKLNKKALEITCNECYKNNGWCASSYAYQSIQGTGAFLY